MKLNRRNMFMLMAGAALAPMLPAAGKPRFALGVEQGDGWTVRRYQLERNDRTGEYRINYGNGVFEPTTLEQWSQRGQGHSLSIPSSK